MYQDETQISFGEGRYAIRLTALITSDGLSVTITGGERPHVGGMAMSVPRLPIQQQPGGCDTWIIPRPHHRDADIAAMVSKMVCQGTGHCTAVVAGIHIDGAEPHEIDTLIENSREASRRLLDKIRAIMER